jgi:hypothetical protein
VGIATKRVGVTILKQWHDDQAAWDRGPNAVAPRSHCTEAAEQAGTADNIRPDDATPTSRAGSLRHSSDQETR